MARLTVFTLVTAALFSRAVAQVPTPDHIVIVIEENHAYSQIIGLSSAPFINGLRDQGALLTNSYAITHPSQPNYLALFSGSTQGMTSDTTPTNLPFTTANLGAQLLLAGLTFAGYSESLPSVGYTGDNAGGSSGYFRKHNPWVNWQRITGTPPNTLPTTVNLPYTQFPSDYTRLPRVSFVIPTELHDMHNGTIAQGDTWLSNNLNNYIQWAKAHNSIFILTFDEDDDNNGNHIATILVGQPILAGVTSSQSVTHYNMLATVEDMTGLPRIGSAAGAQALTGIFKATVSGNVDLNFITSPAGQTSTIEFRTPSTQTVVYSAPITLDSSGNYTINNVPPGTYDVALKFTGWLRQVLPSRTIAGATSGVNFSMLGGDAFEDNMVDLFDLNQVVLSFGTSGAPGFDPGDLNWDGSVDTFDLNIILVNFGAVGDN